jgi:Flp pilus assembly protein TadB
LGIGDWAQSPIPNPQSPIPNPHIPNYKKDLINNLSYLNLYKINIKYIKLRMNIEYKDENESLKRNKEKKKEFISCFNIDNQIKIYTILAIFLIILLIIFFLFKKTIITWIIFFLTIMTLVLLIITIILKSKKKSIKDEIEEVTEESVEINTR